MILDLVYKKFWKPEYDKTLLDISSEIERKKALFDNFKEEDTENDEYLNLLSEVSALYDAPAEMWRATVAEYIDSFDGDPCAVIFDARSVVDAVTRDDFERFLKILEHLKNEEPKQTFRKEGAAEEFDLFIGRDLFTAFVSFLLLAAEDQLAVLRSYDKPIGYVVDYAIEKAGTIYPTEENSIDDPLYYIRNSYIQTTYAQSAIGILMNEQDDAGEPEPIERRGSSSKATPKSNSMGKSTFVPVRRHVVPLDKVNSTVFDKLAAQTLKQFLVNTGDKTKNGKSVVVVEVSFDSLEEANVNTTLTPYDQRVYTAVNALQKAGNEYITPSQIYREMGHTKSPPTHAVSKVNESLRKMQFTRLSIDNTSESATQKSVEKYTYEGYLLPIERVTHSINGKIVESCVHVLKNLPLMDYAKVRGQITEITPEVLQSPIDKTDRNIEIENYFIKRISHIKNNARLSNRILYSTVFDKIKVDDRKIIGRTKNVIHRILEYYKEIGFIRNYTEDQDGITITR